MIDVDFDADDDVGKIEKIDTSPARIMAHIDVIQTCHFPIADNKENRKIFEIHICTVCAKIQCTGRGRCRATDKTFAQLNLLTPLVSYRDEGSRELGIEGFDNMSRGPKIDHANTRCCICESMETYVMPNGDPLWRRYKSKNGIWDGKSYMCESCRHKSNTKYRNKIDKSSTFGMVIISQAVVKKVIGATDCVIKTDNCNYPIDLLDHKKHGKIDVKYSVLDEDKEWYFSTREKLDADTYFCLGFSKDGNNIEKVWIIPNEDWVVDLKGVSIYKESCVIKSYRYNQYSIDPKLYDDTYQSLMLYLKDVKFFGMEDIRKWLKE